VISPLSAATALLVLSRTSRGKTAQALEDAIGLPTESNPVGAATLLRSVLADVPAEDAVSASALWISSNVPLEKSFVLAPTDADLIRLQGSEGQQKERMARWVRERSRGLIQDSGSAPSEGGFTITNVVYFKGTWTQPFLPSMTVTKPFYGLGAVHQDAKIMVREEMTSEYWADKSLQAVRMSFNQGLDYVVFIGRNREHVASIWKHLQKYDAPKSVERLLRGDGFQRREVIVELPKVSVSATENLLPLLPQLNLGALVDRQADYTRISAQKTGIAGADQQARLDIDEKGAVAAAFTHITTMPTLCRRCPATPRPQPIRFIVDRPYVAFLVNRRYPEWPVMVAQVDQLPLH
jgi:serpin B